MGRRFGGEVARQPALRREQALQRLTGYPLTALLREQQRLVEVYRAEYFRVGSSTEPADRGRAERAITALYAEHGHAVPRFEWGPSPRWGVKRRASLRVPLRNSLRDSLRASLQNALGAKLWASLWASLWDSLRASLRAPLLDSLGDSLRASLLASLGASLGASLVGSQEAYWVAHYLYGYEVLTIPYSAADVRRLYLHDEVVRSCGWWWPYRSVCLCTDRPEILEWTEERPPKLQRVRYRDGWEVTP